jgi:hypothetical protein
MHARSDASSAGSMSPIPQPIPQLSLKADAAYGCVDWYQYDSPPAATPSQGISTTTRVSLADSPAAALAVAATLLDSVMTEKLELRSA